METPKIIQLDDAPRYEITEAVNEARKMAHEQGAEIRFSFNGVEMRVQVDSRTGWMVRDFMRAMSGCHSGPVGPHPPEALSAEQQARDAEVEAENEKRRQQAHEQYEREKSEKQARLNAETEAGTFSIVDAEAWDRFIRSNEDPYGSGVVRYAEAWARLMEARMQQGNELEAIAQQASHDADTEGITGFMYGCAVSTLCTVWKHGERLRRWHNLATQLQDEGVKANEKGTVLNPALITIG